MLNKDVYEETLLTEMYSMHQINCMPVNHPHMNMSATESTVMTFLTV